MPSQSLFFGGGGISDLLKLYQLGELVCLGRHDILPGSLKVHTLLGNFVEKKRDLISLAPESSHFLSGTGVEFLAQLTFWEPLHT